MVLDTPPPSRVRAATMHMQSTAKGERSCRASKVSLPESKTGLQKDDYEFCKRVGCDRFDPQEGRTTMVKSGKARVSI